MIKSTKKIIIFVIVLVAVFSGTMLTCGRIVAKAGGDNEIEIPYDRSIIETNYGDNVELKVTATTQNGELSYQWYYWEEDAYDWNESKYKEIQGSTSASLMVKADETASKLYKCEVSNGIKNKSVEFVIYIDTGLKVGDDEYNNEKFISVKYGDEYDMVVKASNDIGNIKYQWYYGIYDYGTDDFSYSRINDIEGNIFTQRADETGYNGYKCVVSDGINEKSFYFRIFVDSGFTVEYQKEQKVKYGENIKLTIDANSITNNISYVWYYGSYCYGKIIEDENTNCIQIKADETADKTYTCKVSDGVNEKKVTFIITIDTGLSIVYEEQKAVKNNENLTLQVDASNDIGNIKYQWYYGDYAHNSIFDWGNSWEGNYNYVKIDNATSPILDIKVDGKAHPRYVCVVTDGCAQENAVINLKTDLSVSYKDKIKSKDGYTSDLEINVGNTERGISYQWYYLDGFDNAYYYMDNATERKLTISKGGSYMCEVTDGISLLQAVITVDYSSYKDIELSYIHEVEVKYGEKTNLSVSVLENGNGETTSQWYYYDDVSKEYIKMDGETGLSLEVVADDSAYDKYMCEVTDSITTDTAYINLIVDEPEIDTSTKKLQLNQKQATVAVGDTVNLKATVTPANTTDKMSWKSSNSKIATVAANGKVVAKKVGTVNITVTSGTKKATCKIIIKPAPKMITLNKTKVKIKKGKSTQLKYSITKGSLTKVTFTSNNKKVATVDNKGKVIAKKTGKAIITVKTSNGKTAKCQIEVVK